MRVRQSNFDIVVPFLQANRRSGKRTARSHSGHKTIDLVVCIAPDFLRRGLDMGLPVDRIVELIGPYCAIRLGFGQLLGKTP